MLRALVCALLSTAGVSAQAFGDLAVTQDNSVLYFSSNLRQKGTSQSFHSKIFRWSASGGIQVIAEEAGAGVRSDCSQRNYRDLGRPQVSMDGRVLLYSSTAPWERDRPCGPTQSVVQRFGTPLQLSGMAILSPNGRYAVSGAGSGPNDDTKYSVTDLETGRTTRVAGRFPWFKGSVTNEGAVLTWDESILTLTDLGGKKRVISTRRPIMQAVVDARGKTIVYNTSPSGDGASHMSAINVDTGSEIELGEGLFALQPVISSDGATVLFLAFVRYQAHIFAVGTGGENLRRVSNEPDSLLSFTSGDGMTAFATTMNSRLVRINLASGTSQELVGPSPSISAVVPPSWTSTALPLGGMVSVIGFGLESVEVLSICGLPAPYKAGSRFVQIPWDAKPGRCQLRVSSSTPFESAYDFDVVPLDPKFPGGPEGPSSIFKDRFAGYVTFLDPARTGDIVSIYMSGLGPLDRNGNVGPGFRCSLDAVPAEVRFAGQASGYPGYYQINLVIPQTTRQLGTLVCGFGENLDDSLPIFLAN